MLPAPLTWLTFALITVGLVLTPGPNMIYLVSRSICQGRKAGLISLGGVALGFVCYVLCASFGITAILLAVPFAFGALKTAGAVYLAWLAWQALKPGAESPFKVRDLPIDSPRKLFAMGFLTNMLNPKAAMFYLSFLPQFIDRGRGHVLAQSLILGATQITLSVTINTMIAIGAGSIARFLAERPTWSRVQRWVMGCVLGGLAVRIATERAG